MDWRAVLAVAVVVGVLGAGYVQYTGGNARPATADNQPVDADVISRCERVQQLVCSQQSGNIYKEDYPDQCFVDEENVLETPYTCPE